MLAKKTSHKIAGLKSPRNPNIVSKYEKTTLPIIKQRTLRIKGEIK